MYLQFKQNGTRTKKSRSGDGISERAGQWRDTAEQRFWSTYVTVILTMLTGIAEKTCPTMVSVEKNRGTGTALPQCTAAEKKRAVYITPAATVQGFDRGWLGTFL